MGPIRPVDGGAAHPPVGCSAYTVVRGEIVGWYPYPFLDVGQDGYAASLLATSLVAVVLVVLAAGAGWLDHRMKLGVDSPRNRQDQVGAGR